MSTSLRSSLSWPDSLSASVLRNHIIAAVHASVPGGEDAISLDWIYSHPTLEKLSDAMVEIAGLPKRHASDTDDEQSAIPAMLQKYNKALPVTAEAMTLHPPSSDGNLVVLLTGSTGSLGSHLLFLLLNRSDVQKVYCLNRSSLGQTLIERQKNTFGLQGFDIKLLDSPKVVLLSGRLTEPDFGLDSSLLDEVRY